MTSSVELTRLPPSAAIPFLDLGYCVGELVQIGAERSKEPLDREPLDSSPSSLDAGDVGRVHLEARCKLLLRYPSSIPQRSESAAKDDQVGVSCVLGQGRVGWYSGSGCATLQRSNIVPPHRCNGRGRGAEDQGFSTMATIPARVTLALSPGLRSSVPPTKEEPKMTPNQYPDGEPATERIIVLQLLRNDRSEWWGRAEMLRKLRDIDPDAVRGSLAHLERLGLLDRNGARFKASDGLRYVDDVLDLIGI
jgi:hypothetical protein